MIKIKKKLKNIFLLNLTTSDGSTSHHIRPLKHKRHKNNYQFLLRVEKYIFIKMSSETSLKAKAGSFQSLGLDKALLNGLNRIGYKVLFYQSTLFLRSLHRFLNNNRFQLLCSEKLYQLRWREWT